MGKRWLLVIIVFILLFYLSNAVLAKDICGDSYCTGVETCQTCSQDCGLCNIGSSCSANSQCSSGICSCGVCSNTPPPECCSSTDCGYGYTCESGTCVATCTPTCSVSGKYSCSGNDLSECVSVDGCLQWQLQETCPSGTTCQASGTSGNCSSSCTDTCKLSNPKACYNSTVSETCGDYNNDGCLEWKKQNCSSGSVCVEGGVCKALCTEQGADYFCGSSDTLTILFNQYYCDSGSCYTCNADAHAVQSQSGNTCICDPSSNYPSQCGTGTSASCVNFQTDPNNCGGCDIKCDSSTQVCSNGQCISNTCSPGATQSCYTGSAETNNVGICQNGTQTCNSDGTWGSCTGQVTPQPETCNGVDDNCNGKVDENVTTTYYLDKDGDGYGESDHIQACSPNTQTNYTATEKGDCNDNDASIYPGAQEVCNGLDDDCDGTVDNPPSGGSLCDAGYTCSDGSCVQNCEYPYFCSSSAGPLANLFSQYYCSSGSCYECITNAHPSASSTTSNSTCVCDSGYSQCGTGTSATCVNLTTDTSHCGSCDNACASGAACIDGKCGNCSKDKDCNDDNPCTTDECINDQCTHTNVENNEPCGNNNLCYDGNCTKANLYYQDYDGDSYGNPKEHQRAISEPNGYVTNNKDCDDSDASVYPGAQEYCNGVDDNCNGQTDENPKTLCGDGDVCKNDSCVCTDECTRGEKKCENNKVVTCGDFDADTCVEWGTTTECTNGYTCLSGECVKSNCYTDDDCTVENPCLTGLCINSNCEYDQEPNGTICPDGRCQNGVCKEKCTPEPRTFCKDGDIWKGDGCSEEQLVKYCEFGCENATCKEQTCEQNQELCDGECTPIDTHLNCGSCTNTCKENEQCINKTCKEVPDCHVVCDSDTECGEKETCINPGDCQESQCAPLQDIKPLNLSVINDLVRVDSTLTNGKLYFTTTNLVASPVEVSFNVFFPEEVTPHVSHLIVVNANPKEKDFHTLSFKQKVESSTRFVVFTKEPISHNGASKIKITDLNATGERSVAEAINKTKDAVSLGMHIEKSKGKTKVELTVTPKKSLGGVRVPIEIPKCMAQYTNQLNMDGKYQVIKDDPLIMWTFDEVDKPKKITFEVPKDIDEECLKQLKALAYAQRIGKPLNPLLALLIIPIIALILIWVQRPHINKKLIPKSEFWEIAKRQGSTKNEIERRWRDYKRRF